MPNSDQSAPALTNGDTISEAITPTLDKFVANTAPYLKKVTDELYGHLLDGVQDYLRENAQWNIGAEIDRCRAIQRENYALLAERDALAARVAALEEAIQVVIDQASSSYRARNGRQMSIQADDGEACEIVHSDAMHHLRTTLGGPDAR